MSNNADVCFCKCRCETLLYEALFLIQYNGTIYSTIKDYKTALNITDIVLLTNTYETFRLNLWNFPLFLPQAQNISGHEGPPVLGNKLSRRRVSQFDFRSLSHSFKELEI